MNEGTTAGTGLVLLLRLLLSAGLAVDLPGPDAGRRRRRRRRRRAAPPQLVAALAPVASRVTQIRPKNKKNYPKKPPLPSFFGVGKKKTRKPSKTR